MSDAANGGEAASARPGRERERGRCRSAAGGGCHLTVAEGNGPGGPGAPGAASPPPEHHHPPGSSVRPEHPSKPPVGVALRRLPLLCFLPGASRQRRMVLPVDPPGLCRPCPLLLSPRLTKKALSLVDGEPEWLLRAQARKVLPRAPGSAVAVALSLEDGDVPYGASGHGCRCSS